MTEVKRRVRGRKLSVQIHLALDDAAIAMKSGDVSQKKLAQVRLQTLQKIDARSRRDKVRKLTEENESLKTENEKLRHELAAARPRPVLGRLFIARLLEIRSTFYNRHLSAKQLRFPRCEATCSPLLLEPGTVQRPASVLHSSEK